MEDREPLKQPDDLSCCVVWTPIPLLSWVSPLLGHVGICNSSGVVHDFQGPGYVGKGHMLFGDPRQKWKINLPPEIIDSAIEEVSEEFKNYNYDLCCSNCHFFVCSVLKRAGLPVPFGCCTDWTFGATAKLIVSLVAHSKSISACDFFAIWIPSVIFWAIIVGIILLVKLV